MSAQHRCDCRLDRKDVSHDDKSRRRLAMLPMIWQLMMRQLTRKHQLDDPLVIRLARTIYLAAINRSAGEQRNKPNAKNQ